MSVFRRRYFSPYFRIFVWVAARLLHENPIPSAEPSYLHIYPFLLHVDLPTTLIRVRNGPFAPVSTHNGFLALHMGFPGTSLLGFSVNRGNPPLRQQPGKREQLVKIGQLSSVGSAFGQSFDLSRSNAFKRKLRQSTRGEEANPSCLGTHG
jgi:hypothetical protein